MRLEAFLKQQNLSQKEFAQRVNCSRVTIYRISNDLTKPSKRLLDKIIAETSGSVTPNDFFDLPS